MKRLLDWLGTEHGALVYFGTVWFIVLMWLAWTIS